MFLPGAFVIILGTDMDALEARSQGLRLKDTILILVPGPRILTAYLFQFPLDGTVGGNVIKHGVGGLQIDGSRIRGRWPPNMLLVHASGCQCVGTKYVLNTGGELNQARPRENAVFGRDARPRGDWTAYGTILDPKRKSKKYEAVPDWRCVPGCPALLLDQGTAKEGMSRLFPQFATWPEALDWLSGLIGPPRGK
jgi:hypothetical protein